jgi:hypothetical protein
MEDELTASNDKERVSELNQRTSNFQAKVPADRLEALNINDIVQTMQDELRKVQQGNLQQPRKAG